MVVDGQSLAVALKHHRDIFGEVAKNCEAVVCCRMSPIQKAEVNAKKYQFNINRINLKC